MYFGILKINRVDTFIYTIKKYSQIILKVLLFIAASGIVLFLLPRAGKFKYEYAKDRPWKYSDLISGFDFPIYKTTEELNHEKDSVLQKFRPYFLLDSNVINQSTNQFTEDFYSKFPEFQNEYNYLKEKKRIRNGAQSIGTVIKNKITNSIKSIYEKGIIILPEQMIDVDKNFEFYLIKGNFLEPYELSEVYTSKSAYQTIQSSISKFIEDSVITSKNYNQEEVLSFVSRLQLNKYLNANISYDKKRSDFERQELLKNIPQTSGAIKSGQLIIAKGEVVNEETAKIIDSYKFTFENRLGSNSGYSQILIGQSVIVLVFFLGVYLFLFYFRKDVYENNKSISFILLLMVGMILFARGSYSFYYIPVFIIPFAILPITIRTFFDSRLALFIHIITILLASFFTQNSFQFVFLQIGAGITSIFSLFRIERRSQLVNASVFITLVYSLLYTALFLWQEGDIKKIDPFIYAKFSINGALLLLTYLAIYIFEKLFGFLSDVTLAELSNSNHPLISKLAEQTPGTFHHSIQVGNLAMEAVKKIGGNPLLVYAGAMYHDIGKLEAPSLFTENQITGINPLNNIDLERGAQMVISHIENGIKLAKRHNLPQQIIDFIATHQGTTKAKYFYNSFVNKNPDTIPDISVFTYPGPTPFTKETAVLMMSDSIEAASRSLSTINDDAIDKLVENIINEQMEQNQFINAPITLREITEVKEIFKKRLKIIYHSRIKYPELDEKS